MRAAALCVLAQRRSSASRPIRDTPIPPPALARYDDGMDEPEAPRGDKYVETARDRRIANAVLLFFLIVVVGGGIWLANAMFEQRRLDDCLAQGGRNCAPPIEAPAR
jgi:hypothetical protein